MIRHLRHTPPAVEQRGHAVIAPVYELLNQRILVGLELESVDELLERRDQLLGSVDLLEPYTRRPLAHLQKRRQRHVRHGPIHFVHAPELPRARRPDAQLARQRGEPALVVDLVHVLERRERDLNVRVEALAMLGDQPRLLVNGHQHVRLAVRRLEFPHLLDHEVHKRLRLPRDGRILEAARTVPREEARRERPFLAAIHLDALASEASDRRQRMPTARKRNDRPSHGVLPSFVRPAA